MEISASSFNPASVQRSPINQQASAAQEQAQATPHSSAQALDDKFRAPEKPQRPEQPPLRDELSPEEKNNLSDELYERTNDVKSERQDNRDSVRETVVQISIAQQQKANLELYIEQSSGEEIEGSASISPQEVIELAQTQQRNNTLQAVADSDISPEDIQNRRRESQQQALQEKFAQGGGDNTNPPSIDLNV